ncbi:Phenylalanyl-tRNA synthetase beta chain [hydrothermal vent metagenome]|uniref:Phenylalanine--tRNA ligase beta subunit n=1 Tax=hydrothermal vent metagenome TaxID=652676 RepID=A0A3B0T7C8_9ZZZZ
MKFTLSWLKAHLETEKSLDELTDKLTMIGLEVEDVHNPSELLAPFHVAHVVSAAQHPNADRLRVCIVDTGTEKVQVVCGAPNARTGMRGVFAPSGTTIPGTGLHLKPTTIRGVESNGMLCSEREMGLSDEHDGIIELPGDAPIGAPFASLVGLDDPVIEIAITPNRSDCLGVYGIARDLAAADMGTLKDGGVEPVTGTFDSPVDIRLDFDEATKDACPVFAGRMVRGLKNGPSPEWLQRRLRAIGLRPINALVDITNFITYDRGRPLHVYDASLLTGDIGARMGRAGESFTALDGKTYEVDETVCVIADEARVLGLGGIMGGTYSGSQAETTDVFIECAIFDPVRTAETGRRFGIDSDARYRFERGVDPAFVEPGLDLATAMVIEICGGAPSRTVVAGKAPDTRPAIDFDLAQVKRLTGIDLPAPEIRYILKMLGFWVAGLGDANVKVAAPSWRPDIHGAADLVEEVLRIAGMDRLPVRSLPTLSTITRTVATLSQTRSRKARRGLAGRGMVELVTWSFISRTHAQAFGGGQDALELLNPISSEMSSMRPGLLPGLVAAATRNADRGFADFGVFEVGQAYRGIAPEDQYASAAGIRRGQSKLAGEGRDWREPAGNVDAYDAKADAMATLAGLGVKTDKVQIVAQAPGWYHPGRSAVARLGPKNVLAAFGEMHPGVLKTLGAQGPLVAFEVFLDAIPAPRSKSGRSRPALEAWSLQPVTRDLAFLADDTVPAGDLIRAAKGADTALITNVKLFDVYQGTGVGEGKISLAIEVTLQPREKSLTDEDIDKVMQGVVAKVEKATGAALRG